MLPTLEELTKISQSLAAARRAAERAEVRAAIAVVRTTVKR